MSAKDKKSKKAKKAAENAAREAAEAAAKVAARKQKRLLIAIPLLTAGAAAACWFGLGDKRLVGVSILIGGLVFLLVALGTIGSSVTPRDRLKSGSIDFGGGDTPKRDRGRKRRR